MDDGFSFSRLVIGCNRIFIIYNSIQIFRRLNGVRIK